MLLNVNNTHNNLTKIYCKNLNRIYSTIAMILQRQTRQLLYLINWLTIQKQCVDYQPDQRPKYYHFLKQSIVLFT